MRRWILTLMTVLLLSSSLGVVPAGAAGENVPWLTKADAYTIVYYGPGMEADADQALSWMQEARAINQRVLGTTLNYKPELYLYPAHSFWSRGEGIMDSSAREGIIRGLSFSQIKDPVIRRNVPKVLTHELAHLLSGQMRPNYLDGTPSWFVEGLAEYVAVWGSERADFIAWNRNLDDDLYRAAQRGELNGFSTGTVYFRGSQAVRFLFDTFGKEKMQALVRTNSGDLVADMQTVLGASPAELHDAWLRWVSANWQIPLSTLTGNPEAGGVAVADSYSATVERTRYELAPYLVPTPVLTPVQVRLQVGKPEYWVGERSDTAAVAPFIQDGTTMVPLRALTEALGARVDWNGETREITISLSPDLPAAPERPAPEPGRYIHVPAEQVLTLNQGPVLAIRAGSVQPMPVEDLALAVSGPKYALSVRVMDSPAEIKTWGITDYATALVAYIPMVSEADGSFRSQYPVIIREQQGVQFKVTNRNSQIVDPQWELTPAP